MIDRRHIEPAIRSVLALAQHVEYRWHPPNWYVAQAVELLTANEPGIAEFQRAALFVILGLANVIGARHAPAHGDDSPVAPANWAAGRHGSAQASRRLERLARLARPREAKEDDDNA